MPPLERRATILDAAVPMVATPGLTFTTQEVADAAGIAEGTLFRVFPTKADLVQAVIEQVLDPTTVCRQLSQLRPNSLDEAVSQVIDLLGSSVKNTSAFFASLHARGEKPPTPPAGDDCTRDQHRTAQERRAQQVHEAITTVLQPFAADLRTTPEVAASHLRTLVMAIHHPFLSDRSITDGDEVTALLLHGISKES